MMYVNDIDNGNTDKDNYDYAGIGIVLMVLGSVAAPHISVIVIIE